MSQPLALLCVTRHGETDWNLTGVLQGWIDVPINDRGREQARDMAAALAPYEFNAVCTSPLRRAAETADIIAGAWGLPPAQAYAGIKERHFGLIQGMPKSTLAMTHPGLHEEILRRNPACPFPGGEDANGFADRVLAGLLAIALDHRGQRVLVMTHGWVMDAITRQLRGVPRDTVLGMKRRNGESVWVAVGGGPTFTEVPAPVD